MVKSTSFRRLAFAAALALSWGGARAQDFAARLPEVSAPLAPMVWNGSLELPAAASFLPAAAAAPPLPALAPEAAEAPAALAAAAPQARSAAVPAAAPGPANAPAEDSRANAARVWDGAGNERGGAPAVADLETVRSLALPFRTQTQLAKLAQAPRPAGESYRFAVIGDAEPGRFWIWRKLFNRDPGAFWKLLPRADRAGADFIVQIGDMVSRGVLRNFRAFFEHLRAAAPRTPYLTVIGNHDRHRPHGITNSSVYRSLFGKTDYAFERGGRRFVVLDNSAGRVTPGQLEWLRSVLSADHPAVVFTHMPPAPLGEWTDFGRKGSGGFRKGAEEFMSLMSERKVARVYVGHVHGLGVLERGGVRYVLTGGGGSPLYPGPVKDKLFHYLTVDDGPGGLVETVHPARGAPFVLP
jgi:hypothetical protein